MQEEKVNCVDVSLLWNPNQAQYCSKCKVNTYRSFKFRGTCSLHFRSHIRHDDL